MDSFNDLAALGEWVVPAREFDFTKLPRQIQERVLRYLLVNDEPLPLVRNTRYPYPVESWRYKATLDTRGRFINLNIAKTSRTYRCWAAKLFWAENTIEINVGNLGSKQLREWLNPEVAFYAGNTGEDAALLIQAPRAMAIRKLQMKLGADVDLEESQPMRDIGFSIAKQFQLLQCIKDHHTASPQQHLTQHWDKWVCYRYLENLEIDFTGLDRRHYIESYKKRKAASGPGLREMMERIDDDVLELRRHSMFGIARGVIVRGCPVGELGGQLVKYLGRLGPHWDQDGLLCSVTLVDAQGMRLRYSRGQVLPHGSRLDPVKIDLMKLPTDIIRRVLDFLLNIDGLISNPENDDLHTRAVARRTAARVSFANHGILQTCKELYTLGVGMLYQHNHFEFAGQKLAAMALRDGQHQAWLTWSREKIYDCDADRQSDPPMRLSQMRRIILGSPKAPLLDLIPGGRSPEGPSFQYLDRIFPFLNLTTMTVHFDNHITSVAQAVLRQVREHWIGPAVRDGRRVVVDMSYRRDTGVWTITQPSNHAAQQFDVRNLELVGSPLNRELGLEDLDTKLRNFLGGGNEQAGVCRRVAYRTKTMTNGVAIEADDLDGLAEPWCADWATSGTCLCERGRGQTEREHGGEEFYQGDMGEVEEIDDEDDEGW